MRVSVEFSRVYTRRTVDALSVTAKTRLVSGFRIFNLGALTNFVKVCVEWVGLGVAKHEKTGLSTENHVHIASVEAGNGFAAAAGTDAAHGWNAASSVYQYFTVRLI